MIIEDVFDYKIVRILCDDTSLYKNTELDKSVNFVLQMPSTTNRSRGSKGDSHVGPGVTSVGQPYVGIVYLPGSANLTQWLKTQLLSVQEIFGYQNKTDVLFKRSWANRLLRGAQGLCHNHVKLDDYMKSLTDYTEENFKPDLVAILYVDVPENSSNLVFVRNGKSDTYLEEYMEQDRFIVKPKMGELVIHKPENYHAVSVHNSDLPRTVFVFDIDYSEQ